MNLSLSHFLSTDNLRLPGLLYEPEMRTHTVAIFLHGCGSSSVFYKPEMNLWGNMFTEQGVSFFPFNNRGAHFVKSFKRMQGDEDERVLQGTYFEHIHDCIHDIDGAIKYLQGQGYEKFYLIGHSTGANKICVYNYYKKDNLVSKYILLAGGDDTGLHYQMLGKAQFEKALNQARIEIKKGNGMKQVPPTIFAEPYSWQSLYDVLNPDGDYNTFPFFEYLNGVKLSTKPLFREFQSIDKPTLVVYGDQDEYCYDNVNGCIGALKAHSTNNLPPITDPSFLISHFSFQILKNANHGFDGKENELGKMMIQWLNQST